MNVIKSNFDSHQVCNICKKSCLEMASVGIETMMKAVSSNFQTLAGCHVTTHSKSGSCGSRESVADLPFACLENLSAPIWLLP